MAKKKQKEYCNIEISGLKINNYNIPEGLGQDEYDEEFSLSIIGCNFENTITIEMPPCYDTDSTFSLEITSNVAKQIIRTMELIIKEQELE